MALAVNHTKRIAKVDHISHTDMVVDNIDLGHKLVETYQFNESEIVGYLLSCYTNSLRQSP